MAKLYEYEATGTSVFPVDMLRYDSAWPSDTESAILITKGRRELPRDENGHLIQMVVRIHSNYPPTIDRWRSFGWNIRNERRI